MVEKKTKVLKNRDVKSVELNLDPTGTYHTNPNGKKVKIKVIGDEYFSKRKRVRRKSKGSVVEELDKSTTRGCSYLFPNHLEYNGWLSMNNLVAVDVEELEDKWS